MALLTRRATFAVAAAACCPIAARAEDVTLRVSTAAPPSDFLARSLGAMKDRLDGSGLNLQVFPASTLFKQGTEVPALQRGTLEMSTMTTFEVAQQIPELGFFNRAYLLRDLDHLRRVFDGPIGEDYRRTVADKMGIVILTTTYLGTRQVNLRQARKVNGPDDFAGVRMRMTAGPEWLLLARAIGLSPVPMGMPEVYLALKTGTIDGQENPLSILAAAKFYEVTQQVVLTSHLVQPVFINIAKPVWDKLSPDQQAHLSTAAAEAGRSNAASRLADETKVADDLRSRGLDVASVDLAPFRTHADAVYADAARGWNAALMERVAAA